MIKIERPDWGEIINTNPDWSIKDNLDHWWDKFTEGAVEVRSYGVQRLWRNPESEYHYDEPKEYYKENETHKAYLIGIEPIKKETAEDLLKIIIKEPGPSVLSEEFIKRAKKVLEGE